jgi:hypothetical protein
MYRQLWARGPAVAGPAGVLAAAATMWSQPVRPHRSWHSCPRISALTLGRAAQEVCCVALSRAAQSSQIAVHLAEVLRKVTLPFTVLPWYLLCPALLHGEHVFSISGKRGAHLDSTTWQSDQGLVRSGTSVVIL